MISTTALCKLLGRGAALAIKLPDGLLWIRNVSLSIAVILVVLFAGGLTFHEVFWVNRVVIQPIEVPKELSEKGISSRIAAQRLYDKLLRINDLQDKQWPLIGPEWVAPDLALPGLEMSLRQIIGVIKSTIGRPDKEIAGEIIHSPSASGQGVSFVQRREIRMGVHYELHLRVDGQSVKPTRESRPRALSDIDKLFEDGAELLLRAVDASLLAGYYRRHKPELAEEIIEYCLRECSATRRASSYYQLAQIHSGKGRHREAIYWYKRSLLMKDDEFTNLINIGYSYEMLGDREQARSWYEKAYDVQHRLNRRNRAIINNNLGAMYLVDGNLFLAQKLLLEALAYDPKLELAHRNLGSFYLTVGEGDKARNHFERVLELELTNKNRHLRELSRLFLKQGDALSAEEKARAALQNDPKDHLAYYRLAVALEKQGDFQGALKGLRDALRIDHRYDGAYAQLAHLLNRMDQEEEAFAVLETAADEVANPGFIYAVWGEILLRHKKHSEAAAKYILAEKAGYRTASATQNWGYAYFNGGEYSAAAEKLREAAKLDATNPGIFDDLADACVMAKEWAEADQAREVADRLRSHISMKPSPILEGSLFP
ncbi:MAG: tetratricopeptide repeat protein [Alphaproteobacteria bacterium]|nr:tetratricopeptide repeat protein [Alphaproteobacteria bacterium]